MRLHGLQLQDPSCGLPVVPDCLTCSSFKACSLSGPAGSPVAMLLGVRRCSCMACSLENPAVACQWCLIASPAAASKPAACQALPAAQ